MVTITSSFIALAAVKEILFFILIPISVIVLVVWLFA